MPKEAHLQDLFQKHFAARAFRWSVDQVENTPADQLDALLYIESQLNIKEREELEKEKNKTKVH